MPEYLVKHDGYWRFVRRTPKEFVAFDRRKIVQLSTRIRVTDDPRAIRASQRAHELNAVLERKWFDLSNGVDTAKATLEYDAAVKAAKRLGLSAPIDDPAQRTVAQLLARIETLEGLLKDRTVSDDDKRAAALAAYDATPKPPITFRECAEQYIATQKPTWKSARHIAQWENTLAQYVYPVIGSLPVSSIGGNGDGTNLILKILEPIWHSKVETAARVRGRVESILDWAKARGYRDGDNPARWSGHLDKILPAKRRVAATEHHPAFPYVEMPAFMKKLRAVDGTAARCLEFTILTACRTSEALGARKSEINLQTRMWTIPAARMKTKKEHRVPLSDSAVAILKAMKNNKSDYVFPSIRKRGIPLSGNMLLLTLERMGERHRGVTHGFRSSSEIGQPRRLHIQITSLKWRWPMISATRSRPLIVAAI
jgi:integrase